VQDHVHARQAGGGAVLLLALKSDVLASFRRDLQEQRARAAGGVVGSGCGHCVMRRNANHLGDHATDFGGRVKLPLALAALGGEVPHQVLVGVAENIVVLGAIQREVEGGVFEDGDQRSDCCYQGRLTRCRPNAARSGISACARGAAKLSERCPKNEQFYLL
jgi:hypothetical protein